MKDYPFFMKNYSKESFEETLQKVSQALKEKNSDFIIGKKLDKAYTEENLDLLRKGCDNLIAHIKTVLKSGSNPVVCINSFNTDTEDEHNLIKEIARKQGARCEVSYHWLKGGEGAINLAKAVVDAANEKNKFSYLYDHKLPIKERVETIAHEIYNANKVDWSSKALKKVNELEKSCDCKNMGICMVKTHLSTTHDPTIKGAITGWTLPIRDLLIYKGAGFIVPVSGDIKLMPGTGSNPGFRKIDVDTQTGKITGLF